LPWRGSMGAAEKDAILPTGTETHDHLRILVLDVPAAGHTARACVSPGGTLYSTFAPQALQWLMGARVAVMRPRRKAGKSCQPCYHKPMKTLEKPFSSRRWRGRRGAGGIRPGEK